MSLGKKLTKAEKRGLAVAELKSTEKTYVDQLRLLNIVYVTPLEKKKIISQDQHNTLFSQIKIILNFNTNFLSNLSAAIKKGDSIGQEMLNFCPYFKIYREYVNNYEQAGILLRSLKERDDFNEFDDEGRTRCHNLAISDLIVTPIQRVPRYPMLLKEIIKNSEATHPDLQLLTAALQKYTNLNKDINEGIKEQEKRNKVREIGEKVLDGGKPISLVAPARRFIMKGELWKVCRSKNQKYMFFLFNDLLIYADPQGKYFKFHNKLDINPSFSAEAMDGNARYPPHSIKINSSTKSFVAFADNQMDCEKWLKAMQDITLQLDEREKKKGDYSSADDNMRKAPIMVPDHFFKECQVCNSKFTLIRRRHHCRLCGKVVCGNCSTGRLPDVRDELMRACDTCMEETTLAREVIRPPTFLKGNVRTGSAKDSLGTPVSSGGYDDNKEGTPEASAELFQITFYHGPIPTKTERKKVLWNQARGSFFMSEDGESLLLVHKAGDGKVREIKIGMSITASRTISYTCENPRVSSTSIEDLVTKKLWKPLGLTKAIRRHGHKDLSTDDLKHCARGVALYDYTSQASGDLTLKKGDEIVILDQSEAEGWWTGMVGERTGLFPSTYIEVIVKPVEKVKVVKKVKPKPKQPAKPKKGDIYIGKYDYEQASGEELSFSTGDKIILKKTDDSGWWLGRLESTNKLGWFPPALVEKFER